MSKLCEKSCLEKKTNSVVLKKQTDTYLWHGGECHNMLVTQQEQKKIYFAWEHASYYYVRQFWVMCLLILCGSHHKLILGKQDDAYTQNVFIQCPKVLVRHALSLEKDSNMTKFGFPYSYGATPFNKISLSSVKKNFYGIMR